MQDAAPDADLEGAVAHHRAGRLDEAERLYRKLLSATPGHPQALRLLGILEAGRGRPEQGLELIGRAFPALSRLPEAHVDLGNALRLAGKREEAAESYRQAIALKPDYAIAHARLAGVLCETGRFETAVTHCQSALAVEPRSLPAWLVLIAALKGAGRGAEMAEAWRKVIQLWPERAESHHHLALELSGLKLFTEALGCHNRAIALQPDNALFHCGRGQTLMQLNDGVNAVADFRRAVAIAPESKHGWEGLGWALRFVGKYEEAEACVARLREIDPTDLVSVRHLPSIGTQAEKPEDIESLVAAMDAPDASVEDRITAGFALGRLLDTAGRFDEAFARYAQANALVRPIWPANGDRYDPRIFGEYIDRVIATNTPEELAKAVGVGNVSEMPVFVVGMPRSGTTLVEQICASHSRVFGAGELGNIPRIAVNLFQETGDEAQKTRACERAADAHVMELHRLGGGAPRVVDKLPDNILYVGLIARLFPRARIIYCNRDARDTALSCYFQFFSAGAQFFSYDLADCGRRYRQIQRLAGHWLKLRPFHMFELSYERLVDDLEGESRRLIAFLGLDWEPACLDFHRTERTVATVSHWQVRQPLYRNSVERWRNYERYLEPLLAALQEEPEPAPAPPDAPPCRDEN